MNKPYPLITRPGQIIGFVNGRPVRTIAGGSEPGGDPGTPPAAPEAPAAPAAPAAPSAPATPSDPPNPFAGWDGKVESLPEDAQKIIREARKNAGDSRVAAKSAQDQVVQQIGKALGLIKDDEKPDPAKLTEQLTTAQQAHRQATVELAVFRNASKHQGDPSALLDSRSFLTKVADLDPSAKDFEDKVSAAIKDAVASNTKLKAGQAPGRSSVDHGGGPGERRTTDPKSLADAVSDHYGT